MAKNKIRSGQLLTPFGIGQIVNLPEELSLMICGLNLWDENIKQRKLTGGDIDEGQLRFNEERLQKLLNVEYFVKPFKYSESGINSKLEIPAVRFPQWHHCTNLTCGRMTEVELTFASKNKRCPDCSSKMIPVRFVAACPKGHIQDVPFREWVHSGDVPDDGRNHNLKYSSLSGSGDLGSILISCTCGVKKTLAGLMNVDKNGDLVVNSALAKIGQSKEENSTSKDINATNPSGQYCKGYRPWLGPEGIINANPCGEHLQVLIKGGSNIQYSDIESAIYLPASVNIENKYVKDVIDRMSKKTLKNIYEIDGGKMVLSHTINTMDEVNKGLISADKLLKGIISVLSEEEDNEGEINSQFDIRLQEYQYILKGKDDEISDFKAIRRSFESYLEKGFLQKYFENVVLLEKLKETRVFKGFSRINPNNKIDISELSSEPISWLPAYEIYGEGIFLKFRDDKINKWEQNYGHYFSKIIKRYHYAMSRRSASYTPRELNAAFIMMHTFAHLFIKRLCFSCGYSSSALRERIYYSGEKENRMNGILIYTSSGNSEGSLGGLVRQGKSNYLGKIIMDTIEDSKWCSADPVCSDIGQSGGQGPNNINGSACHNCCLVPETSCEEYNMLLDRATISGTLDEKIGFFS